MGLLDKAKAAATDLAAKADTALSSAGMAGPGTGGGDADRLFRDLGVLAYLEAQGRPADAGERQRVLAALAELDGRGAIRSFGLQTSTPPPPGATGAAAAHGAPPPPGVPSGRPAPPPPAPGHDGAAAPPARPAEPPSAPPPPPSWARGDGA